MSRLFKDTEVDAPLEEIGGKARGLSLLRCLEDKLKETYIRGRLNLPKSFVVPVSFDVLRRNEELFDAADSLDSGLYAVRSSSMLEDVGEHSFDGIFETYLNVPREELARKVLEVRGSAKSDKARHYAGEIGVTLEDEIPVIVQEMVMEPIWTGEVYSKFPAVRNITKVVRRTSAANDRSLIDIFPRLNGPEGWYLNTVTPLIFAGEDEADDEAEDLGRLAVNLENLLEHPVIVEHAVTEDNFGKITYHLLQARKLTGLSEAEKFSIPQLQEKGLIASTRDLNGVGDFSGRAFVVRSSSSDGIIYPEDFQRLREFDQSHPEGYVLVTPYLEFFGFELDSVTPHKRAVVAYKDLGKHHDLELARKNGILYLNARSSLNLQLYQFFASKKSDSPVQTGENLRVVSDGERGFVFNLSREPKN